ncbi:phenylalanine--tRNA ligase subunit alpha [Helicobacter sp. 23-1045]
MDSAFSDIENAKNLDELEKIRISILGKKGKLTDEFSKLKSLDSAVKKEVAKKLNDAKSEFEGALAKAKNAISQKLLAQKVESERIDASLFRANAVQNLAHPINCTFDKIIDYFVGANFSISSGPLIEDDFHNFEALNLPKFHPARDMQDTFYFKDSHLLRTHTSPVQIRSMQRLIKSKGKFPLKIISPGAVFRRDYDITHSPMFHQVEGLVVDSGNKISFANLKFILEDFLRYIFGDEIKVRFRASFFPFTEPSAEVDIGCIFCKGKDEKCRVCKGSGFLEVLGCGVVNHSVFGALKLKNVSGYAFGLGIERFAMLLYGINDLRSFYESDLRLLEQF